MASDEIVETIEGDDEYELICDWAESYYLAIENLVKTVEYYADPATHYGGIETGWVPIVDEDHNGNKARKALQDWKAILAKGDRLA